MGKTNSRGEREKETWQRESLGGEGERHLHARVSDRWKTSELGFKFHTLGLCFSIIRLSYKRRKIKIKISCYLQKQANQSCIIKLYSHFCVTKRFLTTSPIIKYANLKSSDRVFIKHASFCINEEEGVQIPQNN